MKKLFSFILVIFLLAGCSAPTTVPSPSLTPLPSITPTPAPTPHVEQVTNKELTINYSYGSRDGTFNGTLVDGLPNGKGRFDTVNPAGTKWYYEGEWLDGLPQGEGACVWESGAKEEGVYEKGNLINGEISSSNGAKYVGAIKDNKYHGHGKLINAHGDIKFEGEYVEGIPVETQEEFDARMRVFQDQCESAKYSGYARTPDQYFGKKLRVDGKVVQVLEGEDNQSEYRVATKGSYDNVIYVWFTRPEWSPRVLEGDRITMWGTFEGLFTYTSTSGAAVTIPSLDAWVISIK